MPGQQYRRPPAVVALPAEIDISNWELAYGLLHAAFGAGATVVIADFTATDFCDVSSLQRLVAVRRRAAARDAELRLAMQPGGVVHRVVTLTELDRLFPVYPSVREAAGARPPVRPKEPAQSRPGTTAMGAIPDIIGLTGADQVHISHWQARLGQLRRQRASQAEAVTTWDTLATLIDMHMLADDEVCGPAIYAPTPGGAVLARQVRDAHMEIREVIGETNSQPAGDPSWWQLAATSVAGWKRQYYYERHGSPSGYQRRAGPALRRRVASQWRAFREACIRDQYPGAPAWLPTCQLRRARPATPRLAEPVFSSLECTCQTCTDGLARLPQAPL